MSKNKTAGLRHLEVWFVTGSQHLYGEETLKKVAAHSQEIAAHLDESKTIPVKVVYKPTVKSPEEIYAICSEANTAANCIGIIAWMHLEGILRRKKSAIRVIHLAEILNAQ